LTHIVLGHAHIFSGQIDRNLFAQILLQLPNSSVVQGLKASLDMDQVDRMASVEAPAITSWEASWQVVCSVHYTAPPSASVGPDQLRQHKAPQTKQDVITLEMLISDGITTWDQQPPSALPPPSTCQLWQLCCDQVVCGAACVCLYVSVLLPVSVSVCVRFAVSVSTSVSVSVSVFIFSYVC